MQREMRSKRGRETEQLKINRGNENWSCAALLQCEEREREREREKSKKNIAPVGQIEFIFYRVK